MGGTPPPGPLPILRDGEGATDSAHPAARWLPTLPGSTVEEEPSAPRHAVRPSPSRGMGRAGERRERVLKIVREDPSPAGQRNTEERLDVRAVDALLALLANALAHLRHERVDVDAV